MLTVTGDIGTTNAPGSARFDIGMLAQIGKESFTTSTIWTEGELEFTGTPLASLLKVLGVNEGSVRAMALNDYGRDHSGRRSIQGRPAAGLAD